MYEPTLHAVHADWPDSACAVPGEQGTHVVCAVRLLYEPALQPMHAAAPDDGEYTATGHAVQFTWPGDEAKKPAEQAKQAESALLLPNEPLLHSEHAESDDADANEPAGHAVHMVLPDVAAM